MVNSIKIGSRGSRLAVVQVQEIIELLRSTGHFIQSESIIFETAGDGDKTTSLTSPHIADNFFTDALDKAILDQTIDIAVHSAKDLPKVIPEGISIYAITKGLEDSDAWVSAYSIKDLPIGAKVGSSSVLRQKAIKNIRPDIEIIDIRGTIQERIALVDSKQIDALIVATCALKRLGLEDRIQEILPWPGMPLQGQLAVTGLESNIALRNLFKLLDVRQQYGKVTLVGAGPGDSELITLKGIKALSKAQRVFYDYLADPNLLQYAPQAKHIYVGKRKGEHSLSQDDLNLKLRDAAFEGLNIVRLKGGDPLIFGRGADECAFLRSYHIPVDIIPGVSSATGLPSLLGVPLTARGISSSVSFLSGHDQHEKEVSDHQPLLIPKTDTVVVLMGISKLSLIIQSFISQGWLPQTPVMIVSQGATSHQQVMVGDLSTIVSLVNKNNIQPPAIIIVGKTVNFYAQRQLKTYLHTGLHPELYWHYGHIIHWPMIEIKPTVISDSATQDLLRQFSQFDIVIMTSKFAVIHTMNFIDQHQLRSKLTSKIIAVVGEQTALTLRGYGINPDIQPQVETAQGLFQTMSKLLTLRGKKIFFPRSNLSNPFLKQALLEQGALVLELPIYQNIKKEFRSLPQQPIDGVIFTSPSTVKNFCLDYDKIPSHWEIIAKGPVTAKELTDRGYQCRIDSED